MADGDRLPAVSAGAGRKYVRYSEDLAGRIVARVRAGESVPKACRGADMPHATTVYDWARAEPRFGRALAVAHQEARREGRRAARAAAAERWARGRDNRGRWSTYTPELGAEVCRRIVEAQTLKTIGADPEMPCAATILNWAKAHPAFEDAYAQARDLQADVLFDEARDVALAATPGSVWVSRLQFDTIRWMTARMAPKKYCERVLAEAAIAERRDEDDPENGRLTVIVKRFSDVTPEEQAAADATEAEDERRARRRGRA
ncbi:MAG: hypothetical protein ACJ798_15620 [Phenylobacterium sp.]